MTTVVTGLANRISAFRNDLEAINRELQRSPFFIRYCFFVVGAFAMVGAELIAFFAKLPLYIVWGPKKSFETLAPRAVDGTYLISYHAHLRERGLSAATVTLTLLLIIFKVFSIIAVTEFFFQPRGAVAVSSSLTLNPNWDRTSFRNDPLTSFPDCSTNSPTFNCEGATATTIKAGLTEGDVGCDPGTYDRWTYRGALKFDLSTIPNNATITDVSLTLNVSTTTTASVTILRTAVDDIVSSTCASNNSTGMYARMGTGTTYATASNWNTTGGKTYDLGATADSDVQSRLTGSDIMTIGLSAGATTTGEVSSVDAVSNKPQLVVSYTTPPQTPTSAGHSAITTSTVTWSWTDNATADTANYIHDASHAVKCTTGAVSGTGSTGTCQETSLSANTQYTRHVNVVDTEGNSDSSSMAAYTSIETPSGVTFVDVTASGLTVAAGGTLSNVASGSSGVYCQESVTGTNSGWTQTNSWTPGSLTANTQYSVQCKGRNGDGIETSLTAASTKYTLPTAPSVSSTRSASAWYTTPTFPFKKTSGWGAGGVRYLRYVLDHSTTHTFDGTEATWADFDENCPTATCTNSGTGLTTTFASGAQDWYLHLLGYNAENAAGTGQDLGPFWFDPVAPAVSRTSASASQTTLTVSWTTDEAGTSQVEYGPTTSYGSQTAVDASPVTQHSVTIAGLTAGRTYHLRVRSKDVAGNEGISADLTVATLTPDPATVADVQATSIADDNATITWTTSLAATSVVEYGTSVSYGATVTETDSVTTHSVALTSLSPNTSYHYRVSGADSNGQTFTSGDFSFTTASPPTLPATPTITSPLEKDFLFDQRPNITGLSANGTTVRVSLDGKENGTAATTAGDDGVGTFAYRPPTGLSYGTHTVSVIARDADEQASAASKNRIFTVAAPKTPRSVASAVVARKAEPTITISGKAPRTGRVRIILDRSVVKTIAVKNRQTFRHTISATSRLAAGKHTIVLQFLDARGKVRETSRLVSFVKVAKNRSAAVRTVPVEIRIDDSSSSEAALYLTGTGGPWLPSSSEGLGITGGLPFFTAESKIPRLPET